MDHEIFLESEERANKFNLNCFVVIMFIDLIALILNWLGAFPLSKGTVTSGLVLLIMYYSVPLLIYIVHDKSKKGRAKPIVRNPKFKILIMACAFLGIIDLSVTLATNVALVIVIPPLLAAQYKHDRRVFFWVIIASLISVVIITYGGYFFGIYDRWLHKDMDAAEGELFETRIRYATPKRMLELFTHHVVPECFAIAAIDYIAHSITKRTSFMIEKQIDLNALVLKEIEDKNKMQTAVIEDLADVIETRDIETGEHIKRTKKYVDILANNMFEDDYFKDKITRNDIYLIERAAPLHDIGKIAVSDLILLKPGKLDDDEYEKMKLHTTKGGDMIKHILSNLGDEEFLQVAYDIALSHHEKWDGTGYPNGLKGEEIPLSARIMAVADVFDALVAERCYKKPMPVDKAIEILNKDAGTHFDPEIIRIFNKCVDEFKKVAQK